MIAPNETPEQKLRRFDTFTSMYCPPEYKQLCRDISDDLTAKNRLEQDLARVREDLRKAYAHLSPKPDDTLPVVAAQMQQRGIAGEQPEA